MIDVIFYPLLISLPLSLLVGPTGSLLVWRKSSFLTDVIAHMGVLAFTVATLLDIPVLWVSVATSIVVSLLLEWGPKFIPKDAWLASIASLGIAIGVLVLSIFGNNQNMGHLFWGDLLVVTKTDVSIFYIFGAFLGMNIWVCWRYFLLIIFHEELAKLDGIPVKLIKVMFNLIIGCVVAMCLKMMGVLLASALFVLPSVGLRFLKLKQTAHILVSIIIIALSICLGLVVSTIIDGAPAAWIIIMLLILNITAFLIKKGIDTRAET